MANIKQLFRNFNDGSLVAKDEQYDAFGFYQHTQTIPSDTWNISHYMGSISVVNVFINSELVVPNEVVETDNCSMILKFNSNVSGFANLAFLMDKKSSINCLSINPNTTPTLSVTPTTTNGSPSTPILSTTPTPTPTLTPTLTPSATASIMMGAVTTGQEALIGAASLTKILDNGYDDGHVNIGNLPFPFYFNGVDYGPGGAEIYVGSNSYLTFGYASDSYGVFTPTEPGASILIGAADNSLQRLYTGIENNGNTFRIRFEGSGSPLGTAGIPSVEWELTFYRNQIIKLVTGVFNPNSGSVDAISNGTEFVSTFELVAQHSYAIFDPNGDGSSWDIDNGTVQLIPAPTPTPSAT